MMVNHGQQEMRSAMRNATNINTTVAMTARNPYPQPGSSVGIPTSVELCSGSISLSSHPYLEGTPGPPLGFTSHQSLLFVVGCEWLSTSQMFHHRSGDIIVIFWLDSLLALHITTSASSILIHHLPRLNPSRMTERQRLLISLFLLIIGWYS